MQGSHGSTPPTDPETRKFRERVRSPRADRTCNARHGGRCGRSTPAVAEPRSFVEARLCLRARVCPADRANGVRPTARSQTCTRDLRVPDRSAASCAASPAFVKTRYSGLIAVGDRPADGVLGLAGGELQGRSDRNRETSRRVKAGPPTGPRRRPQRARGRGKAGTSDWLFTATQPRRGRLPRSGDGQVAQFFGGRPCLAVVAVLSLDSGGASLSVPLGHSAPAGSGVATFPLPGEQVARRPRRCTLLHVQGGRYLNVLRPRYLWAGLVLVGEAAPSRLFDEFEQIGLGVRSRRVA